MKQLTSHTVQYCTMQVCPAEAGLEHTEEMGNIPTPAGPAQSTPRWAAILPHSAGQVPLSSSSSSNLVLFNADVRYYGKVCCLIFLWQNFPLHAVL